jgi:hypothetical protein
MKAAPVLDSVAGPAHPMEVEVIEAARRAPKVLLRRRMEGTSEELSLGP